MTTGRRRRRGLRRRAALSKLCDASIQEGAWTCSVGDRVTYHGLPGTIRFKGMTSFKAGVWVGMELDEPLGKNDGTVLGVRYFRCDPLHGLFARPDSVVPIASSIFQMLQEEMLEHGFDHEDFVRHSSSKHGPSFANVADIFSFLERHMQEEGEEGEEEGPARDEEEEGEQEESLSAGGLDLCTSAPPDLERRRAHDDEEIDRQNKAEALMEKMRQEEEEEGPQVRAARSEQSVIGRESRSASVHALITERRQAEGRQARQAFHEALQRRQMVEKSKVRVAAARRRFSKERKEAEAEERKQEVQQFLKRHGFSSINAKKRQFLSSTHALHVAVTKGDSKMVQNLLCEGADPTLKDSKGFTPEEVASRCLKGDVQTDILTALRISRTKKRLSEAKGEQRRVDRVPGLQFRIWS